MINTIESRLGIKPGYLHIFTTSLLLAVFAMMLLTIPANAAQTTVAGDGQDTLTEPACTPPNDWGQTTRLKVPDKPSKQWSFTVDEPEMVVTLVFFYYQDYSKAGCAYDCSTGECQTDETGHGQSPFGEFSVMDGKEGANRGSKQSIGTPGTRNLPGDLYGKWKSRITQRGFEGSAASCTHPNTHKYPRTVRGYSHRHPGDPRTHGDHP